MREFYFSFFAVLLCSYCVNADKYCWDSTWYNDSVTLRNGSNYEHQPATVLDAICPNHAAVIAARCKDSKNETFDGTKNDTVSRIIKICHHVIGLICHPYKNDPNATCPDYAIQYGCKCPPSTPNGGTPKHTTKVLVTVTTNEGNGSTHRGTMHIWPAARNSSVGNIITAKTEGGNCTGNSTNGRRAAIKSLHQHRCRNSAKPFENVASLLVTTFLLLIASKL